MEGRRPPIDVVAAQKPTIDTYQAYGFYPDEIDDFSNVTECPPIPTNGTIFKSEPRYETPPTIASMQEMQDVNEIWRQKVGVGHETIEDIAPRLVEEMRELYEAMEQGVDTNRAEIISELADMGLYVLAMMTSLGVRADEAFTAKINRNMYKYNPVHVQAKVEGGMEQPDAMMDMRKNWNRAHDFHFFKKL